MRSHPSSLRLSLAATVLLSLGACGWFGQDPAEENSAANIAAEQREKLQDVCGSGSTYDRLKELIFDQAIGIRNADPRNLDTLATHSVVRMEEPVVKSRDEELNVTVCGGRFILELPPGAERGFGGERRLSAEVEYAAQVAADGSGMVYQIRGAEPIIYKIAAFDLQGHRAPGAAEANAAPPPKPELNSHSDEPDSPAPQPAPPPVEPRPVPAPPPEPRTTVASPSFNCRYARSRSEKAVCSDPRLARLDRAMSSLFYSALSDASGTARAELRRTRDRFLAYREGCGSNAACIADAYQGRMEEIRDIMAADR